MSGWAVRTQHLADGRRQIVSVLLPGDLLGLTLRDTAVAALEATALTPLWTVNAGRLQEAWREPEQYPQLAAALDACAAEDESRLYAQVVRLGRMTAFERVAHTFLELERRLGERGLVRGGSFDMPLTQESLSDLLGLSLVHTNRTLQQMRRMNLIELSRGRLTIKDREELIDNCGC